MGLPVIVSVVHIANSENYYLLNIKYLSNKIKNSANSKLLLRLDFILILWTFLAFQRQEQVLSMTYGYGMYLPYTSLGIDQFLLQHEQVSNLTCYIYVKIDLTIDSTI